MRTVFRLHLVCAVLALTAAAPAQALETVPAAVHVHSDLSTGEFSLEGLAGMAQQEGIEALLLSENYLARVEYGLPPFRALTRVVYDERSVLGLGIDRYLARVAAVRQRFPRLVIVAGVEAIPHYYWTGSPLALDMTVHNTQKNLLVFGIPDARALATLPTIGNRSAGRRGVQSVLDAAAVLLAVPGVFYLVTKRRRRVRVGRAWMVVRRRRWLVGAVLSLAGLVAAVRGWPFVNDAHPYWTDDGLLPHQELIDRVDRLGGVTIWSFPEAADAGERFVGPVRVGWRTEPYADDLLRTARYTSFGAVYEDTTRFERPGEGWDRVLGEYLRGERSRPTWAVAESGFHGMRAGKRLGNVVTVFLAAERSEKGIVDALKRGRMYAVRRTSATGLSLGDFTVVAPDRAAGLGETLRVGAGATIEVRIAIDASVSAQPVRVTLVRNGAVVGGWTAQTPFRVVHRETFDGRPAFFRLDVWGASRDQHLLTNPIFVVGAGRA